jgi:hypothetical protein
LAIVAIITTQKIKMMIAASHETKLTSANDITLDNSNMYKIEWMVLLTG